MAKARPKSKHSRAARRATEPADKSLRDVSPPSPAAISTSKSSHKKVEAFPSTSTTTNINTTTSDNNITTTAFTTYSTSATTPTSLKKKHHRKSILSTSARRRHERGLERGAAIGDRTATKASKSRGKLGVGAARKKAWDDINGAVLEKELDKLNGTGTGSGSIGAVVKKTVRSNGFASLQDEDDDNDDDDDGDSGHASDEVLDEAEPTKDDTEWVDEDEGVVAMKDVAGVDADAGAAEQPSTTTTVADAASTEATNVPLPEDDEVL